MKQRKNSSNHSVDPAEIAQFNALAGQWWDPDGEMAPLHRMNPTRLRYLVSEIKNHFKDIKKISVLDVGCGGGLVSENLARLGMNVTGIDGAEELIRIAQAHAAEQNLAVTYKNELTGDQIERKAKYDVVLALEVIEHVPDPAQFVAEIAQLVKPGGKVIFSTLNRSAASFAFGIVAAEYILRWLPAGTHQWKKFIKPSELFHLCLDAGLTPQQTMGLTYSAAKDEFALDEKNLNVNYFLTATK